MKANVVVGDPNPCGGSERVLLVTMQALLEMGIDFDLTTFKSPDISKLENAYGSNLITYEKDKKINVVNMTEVLRRHSADYCYYDITINTQGNWVPYYHSNFTRKNAITYCHFPSAKYDIESENTIYLERVLGIKVSSDDASTHINNDNNKCSTKIDNNINTNTKFSADSSKSKKEWFRILKYCYWNLIKNSTIITNSEFTRRAIVDAFGIDQIYVLSPPMMLPPFIIMLH